MTTREETKRRIKIMQAYVDGAPIQVRTLGDATWHDIEHIEWNWLGRDYRIKRDQEQKAYEILWRAGGSYEHTPVLHAEMRKGLRAVIDAVKRGELE